MNNSRIIRNLIGLGIAVTGIAGLTGCPKPSTDATSPSGNSAQPGSKQITIAVIPKGTENQFWQSIKAGADDAAKQLNCTIKWDGPNPENDITAQVNIVQTMINSKVDGIVIAACDKTALVEPVKKAIASNIPVVTVDSGINSTDPICYIATNNVKGGESGADALAKEMGEKGKVGLLIFGKGQVSSDEREQGFLQGIKKYPNIKLVSTLEASDTTKAFDNVQNMLRANPDITGIFAASEPNGIGAAQVLDQKKLSTKIKVVAFDASDKEVEALRSGSIQALIVQDPYQMGYKGVETVMKAIKKEPIADKLIDSGLKVVTKSNLDSPEIQHLMHPGTK